METEAGARERLAEIEESLEAYIAREVESAAGRIFVNDLELRARWVEAMERGLYGVKFEKES